MTAEDEAAALAAVRESVQLAGWPPALAGNL
jgi:hypothetical protein